MKMVRAALLGLLLLPTLVLAETRIAVLDMDGVIRSTDAARAFGEKLRTEFAAQEEQLRKLSEEGNALKAKLEKEGDFMSSSDKELLLGQIRQKYNEFQALGKQVREETQRREQEFLQQLRPQVEEVLRELVEERNIDLILDRRRAAVFVKPELDISAAVLDRLNSKK